MFKFFIVFLLIAGSRITNAQNSLNGKITDAATGDPVPGATIYVPELKTGTVADEKGIYRLENLPSATVLIQVSFLGYRSAVLEC